jgi:chromosome segregation ATPase
VAADNASRSVATVDAELTELENRRSLAEQAKQLADNRINTLRDEVSRLRDELHRARESATRLRTSVERRAQLGMVYLTATCVVSFACF